MTSAAYQWKRIHDLVQSGADFSDPALLAKEAMVYAQKELPSDWHDNAELFESTIDRMRKYGSGQSASADQPINATASVPAMNYDIKKRTEVGDTPIGTENAFDDKWHWENLFLDMPPFRFIQEKYNIKSCLDVGCGNGALLDLFKFGGSTDVFGIDGVALASTVLPEQEYLRTDLQVPVDLGRSFDAVFCLEVVEHITPEATRTLIETIARHATDLIVFSMAEPGQPGNGHINCRTMSEVLDYWAEQGWAPVLPDTLAIRALSSLSWFRRNLLVLRPAALLGDGQDGTVLRKIGALKYKWYGQKGGCGWHRLKKHRHRRNMAIPSGPDLHALVVFDQEIGNRQPCCYSIRGSDCPTCGESFKGSRKIILESIC